MKKIFLTQEEIEDLKDDIKFREKVLLQLKQLNGIPKKVWCLERDVRIQYYLITAVIIGGLLFKMLVK